jgi:predicted DNA-binding transcriptional regulator AlpA
VPITGKAVGWIEDEIDAWIEGKIAERGRPQAKKRIGASA